MQHEILRAHQRLYNNAMKIVRTKWLPFGWEGMALGKVIFLTNDALLAHELVHISQQKQLGLLVYLFKYVTSRQFRYEMEKQAYVLGSGMSESDAMDFIKRRYV